MRCYAVCGVIWEIRKRFQGSPTRREGAPGCGADEVSSAGERELVLGPRIRRSRFFCCIGIKQVFQLIGIERLGFRAEDPASDCVHLPVEQIDHPHSERSHQAGAIPPLRTSTKDIVDGACDMAGACSRPACRLHPAGIRVRWRRPKRESPTSGNGSPSWRACWKITDASGIRVLWVDCKFLDEEWPN